MQTGTTQEEEVNKDNEQCKADGKDAIDIQSSKLQTDVTTAVASGKADIFYADTPVAGYAIKQTGDTLEALGEDVGVTPEAVAVKKGDSKTAEAVQKAIQKLMDDGTYKKIDPPPEKGRQELPAHPTAPARLPQLRRRVRVVRAPCGERAAAV